MDEFEPDAGALVPAKRAPCRSTAILSASGDTAKSSTPRCPDYGRQDQHFLTHAQKQRTRLDSRHAEIMLLSTMACPA